MQEDTKPPGIGQYALGTAFGILALAAGGISLGMNVTFGLQAGIVTAAIFGLSDCAKMILPVVTAALGWNTRRRIAWIVASSFPSRRRCPTCWNPRHRASSNRSTLKRLTMALRPI
jgi:hypothetical protein